jgi:hypothetical protein
MKTQSPTAPPTVKPGQKSASYRSEEQVLSFLASNIDLYVALQWLSLNKVLALVSFSA